MKRLPTEKRAAILGALIEGNSIASTCRMTGVAKNTVLDLMLIAGEACALYQHEKLVNLPCTRVQLDEQWSFVGCKEKVKKSAKGEHPGDVWTWKCLCADTKLLVSWHLGDRSHTSGTAFCHDLKHRFAGRVQITSDGLPSYRWAVGSAFKEVDFAQLVKIYALDEKGWERCVGARKEPVFGHPDPDHISTSFLERQNLTTRMTNRRFTRLTNGYSKKLQNHRAMLALGFMAYNFTRGHHTLKGKTPAQAAGVTDHRWTLDELVAMIDNHVATVERNAFEAAFSALDAKSTPPRKGPKSFPPTPKHLIPLPWYLDVNSGGAPSEKGMTD